MATVFVIFGATGDLSKKRIFPALFKLSKNNLLPEKFKIIACARTKHTSQEFREYLLENLEIEDKSTFTNFSKLIDYLSLDIAEDINLSNLSKAIDNFEKQANSCPQKIFYMAVSPQILKKSFENLGKNGLHISCKTHTNTPRIIIEKPFGSNLKSAQDINSTLQKYFSEEQIYRIDHYLGKETVQNIFAFRFANEIFEPVWNNKYIDHVQITTSEYIGVEKRGEYYDKTGALRDIVQNHLIQLMTLVTMEAPKSFNAAQIKNKKLEIIKKIKKLTPLEVENSTVRGQYDGYLGEEKINPTSQTESYALVKLGIQNNRWDGVPFYLRTGKKLTGKVTSIIIQFKEKGHKIPNHITIQIQPNEGIGIELAAKKPGLATELEPVDMEFCYKTSFDSDQPEAYERLLVDVILGDQSLFLSQEIIEESWRIIDPIEKVWQSGKPKLATYKPGTWGPIEAEDLIGKDGRKWLQPLLTICKI
ncbi:MAG: glucose-6-phosphate dehydrogenase [Candidatus Curtissbacteria bacterium]|nr:glucose-6-phosphate dehydrogenase [Candidatus Curtissbacteria bacterium]